MAVKMVNTRAVWPFFFSRYETWRLWKILLPVENFVHPCLFSFLLFVFIYFIQYGSWPIPNAWIALHSFFKPLSRLVRLNGFDQGLNFLSMTVSCSCYRSKSHFVLW